MANGWTDSLTTGQTEQTIGQLHIREISVDPLTKFCKYLTSEQSNVLLFRLVRLLLLLLTVLLLL